MCLTLIKLLISALEPENKYWTSSVGNKTAQCAKGSEGNDKSFPSCLTKQGAVLVPTLRGL